MIINKALEAGTDRLLARPTLSVCIIARNACYTMPDGSNRWENCLKSVRERAPGAEIVVLLAGASSDETEAVARRYADIVEKTAGPRGDWDDMPAFDNAAWARQKSFELAHGRWICWMDSDDRLPGPIEAIELLKANAQFNHSDPGTTVLDSPTNGEPIGIEDLLCYIEGVQNPASTSIWKTFKLASPQPYDVIWCPYLYQRDEHGFAVTWQYRERIVKWDRAAPKFKWAEAAHEILVPIEGHKQSRLMLSNFLFVHEKEFTQKDYDYNIKRHYQINLAQYEKGEVTTRRALYLASAARLLDPPREKEFIDAADSACTTQTDRYRHLGALGVYYADRGLYWHAYASFGAATFLRPDLPDVWLSGGERWAKIEEWQRAADWLLKGISLPYNASESYATPRSMRVFFPALLARCENRLGKQAQVCGEHDKALQHFERASRLWLGIREDTSILSDKFEAQEHFLRCLQDEESQRHAIQIGKLAQFLFDNDEPLKVEMLLKATPYMLVDHPILVELEKKLQPVLRHRDDEAAYDRFYADPNAGNGFIPTDEGWLDPKRSLPRVYWMSEWLNKYLPTGLVCDYGCFDGGVAIPLLKLCPEIQYTGLDPNKLAIEKFGQRIAGWDRDVYLHVTRDLYSIREGAEAGFDAVLWTEVIEHVPDPGIELERIYNVLVPSGHLLMTTPWGSFDKGAPPPENAYGGPRSNLGHLRVVLPRDMVSWCEETGFRIEELWREQGPTGSTGDAMNVVARDVPIPSAPVKFMVPGSLWPWNARESERDGIGASEGMIIQLAERLVKDHDVEVYGPTPQEDIHRFVKYWPREQIRHAEGGVQIVSRAPLFGQAALDTIVKRKAERKILWLQDTFYPDWNEGTADAYDVIVVVSEWHKKHIHETHKVPLEKMVVIYNWYVPGQFEATVPRNPYKFIFASSPDRGIVKVLEAWPLIREAYPDAELHFFYGWKGCERLGMGTDPHWTARYEKVRRRYEELKLQPGVFERGMVGFDQMAKELRSASVWLHPSIDVEGIPFLETCCTLAIQARAAGCVPVCANFAALAETANDPVTRYVEDPRDTEAFAGAAIDAAGEHDDNRQGLQFRVRPFSIDGMLPRWVKVIEP